MKLLLPVTFCFLFLPGCKGKDRIPSGVLPQDKMQDVMWDMIRADQFLASYVLGRDTALNKQAESIRTYQQVLAIHNIGEETFKKSFNYYQSRPAVFRDILDSLSRAKMAAHTEKVSPFEETLPGASSEKIVDTVAPRPGKVRERVN